MLFSIKSSSSKLALLLVFVCLQNFNVRAQIKSCDGIITNKACNNGKILFQELPAKTLNPEELEERGKLDLLMRFRSLVSRSRSRYGLDLSSDVAETFCKQVSLSECRELIIKKESELNLLTEKARIAKAKIDLANKRQKTPEVPETKRKSSVTIIQNRIIERSYDTLEPFPPPTVSVPQINYGNGVTFKNKANQKLAR